MPRSEGHLEMRILGPLEVVKDGVLLPLGGPKQRAVLALLCVHASHSVRADQLVESLWPDDAPSRATTTLQVYVSRLRKLLGAEAIASEGGGYRLTLVDGGLDAARFEQLRHEARALRVEGRLDEAAAAVSSALELWRGAALTDFAYESWAQPEIGRLEEERLTCLEERFEIELALGRHLELVGQLVTLVAAHPLRERLRGQLILALYRSGRQAEALAAYRAARETLVGELGIEPGPELQQLNQQILNQDEALAAPAPDAELARGLLNGRLPVPPTRLIGRERELQELLDLLADARIVTLTGPGGTGKTRLALSVAEQARDSFAGGVHWVGLASLRDPALLREAIGRALNVEGDVADVIADRRALLLLDNFEQIVEAAPELSALATRCPRLTLLVTSRELLRVQGELEYPVPPLADDDAVALFCERTRTEPSAAVGELCRRLDNLPLAVTLAAARGKALSPAQILERLSGHLDLLRGGRDADPRQQTLSATIEWSYQLLSEQERQLYRSLSVFVGGCTLHSAERVCDADLDSLQSLVEKSLLRYGDERYSMFETIREYALELRRQESADEELECRHADYFGELVEALALRLRDPDHAEPPEILARELPNLRAALGWLLEHDPQVALRLAASLWHFWWTRGHLHEGRRWLAASLDAAPNNVSRERFEALSGAGILARAQGDEVATQTSLEGALAVARALGDRQLVADALTYLGGALVGWLDDLERAREVLEESLELHRELGDDAGVMRALGNLGIVAEKQGDLEGARSSYEQTVELARTLGNEVGLSIGLNHLALLLLDSDPDAARDLFGESLAIARSLRDIELAWYALQGLAAAEAASGEMATATVLLGTVDAAIEQIGYAVDAEERRRLDETAARACTALGDTAFAKALAEGRSLSLDDAVDYMLSLGTRRAPRV
ncbi:MAG: BTAD domain-containing putative transcriptional regulator [Gaiellaceae bacterium]